MNTDFKYRIESKIVECLCWRQQALFLSSHSDLMADSLVVQIGVI